MLLFVVEDVFDITGVGVILTPGLGENALHVGTPIRLIRPDGSHIDTTIRGIAFEKLRSISVGKEVRKEDVPIGTRVWTMPENAKDH